MAQDISPNKLYICDKRKDAATLIDEDPSVTLSEKDEVSYEPSPQKGGLKKPTPAKDAKKTYYIKKKDRVSPIKVSKKDETPNGKLRKRDQKNRDKEESEEQHKPSNQNGMYFWNNHLH